MPNDERTKQPHKLVVYWNDGTNTEWFWADKPARSAQLDMVVYTGELRDGNDATIEIPPAAARATMLVRLPE